MSVKKIFWHFLGGGRSWYVRPSGGSYGSEDGTSYNNAWDGFTNINWSVINSGDTLNVCGTHTGVSLIIGKGNINVNFNNAAEAGNIDCNSAVFSGIVIDDFNNVTLNSADVQNSLGQNLLISGTSQNIVTNDCIFSNSPDQGIQHLDSVTAIHNNLTIENCDDEAVSGHGSAQITINGGNLSNNDKAINHIEDSVVTLNGPVIMTGNITYDIEINASASNYTAHFIANNQTFTNIVQATRYGKVTLNNCNAALLEVGNTLAGTAIINNSIVDSITTNVNSVIEATDSAIHVTSNGATTYTLTRCRVTTGVILNVQGKSMIARHSVIIGQSVVGTGIIQTSSTTTIDIAYIIIRGMAASQYALYLNNVLSHSIHNLVIIGSTNVGRGILRQSATAVTISNTVFTDLELDCESFSGANIILNNCCKFDNTTTGTVRITNSNIVTGNPNFVDVVEDDYNLGVGSSCIGTGATLTDDVAIDTADWGDGSTTTPVVTTAEQAIAWNIGAYV